MGVLFQEKMLLRKKVGYQYYQEESLLDKNSMFSIFS